MDVHERIKAARLEKGWSMERLAAEVSKVENSSKPLSWQTVQQWEKEGGSAPKRKRMQIVAELLGLDLYDLVGSRRTSRAVLVSEDDATPYLAGFETLSIPLLATGASMGGGLDQHDDVVVGRLTLSPQWVTKTLKPLTKLENLRFIHGYGDSMEPTFLDGDILLVDAGVRDCDIDGIYVLEANQRLFIKRVTEKIGGGYEITSDNPKVKTVQALDGTQQVNILGRVVWVWNGRKL